MQSDFEKSSQMIYIYNVIFINKNKIKIINVAWKLRIPISFAFDVPIWKVALKFFQKFKGIFNHVLQ